MSHSTVPLLVLLALALGACHEEQHASSFSYTSIDSEGGGALTLNGVKWTFDGTVHYVYRMQSSTADGTERTQTVDGHDFGLRGDTLFIGQREYGNATAGQTVAVTSAGVTVDGEHRGPLPPAKPGEE